MTFTAAQLQQVLHDHMQEGLYLEFKRGAALVTSMSPTGVRMVGFLEGASLPEEAQAMVPLYSAVVSPASRMIVLNFFTSVSSHFCVSWLFMNTAWTSRSLSFYRPNQLDLLRRFPMEYDFYLDHGMQDTEYIKDWRLHVPRGF